MTRRVILTMLLMVLCASTAWGGITYDTVRATDKLILGRFGADRIVMRSDMAQRYPITISLSPTRAAGSEGFYVNATQTSNILTGGLHAGYFTAQAGTVGGSGSGKLMALEAKTRQPDAGVPYHSTIYVSCDVKDNASTEVRGIEISMDGDTGGSATTAYGVKMNNNSSGTYGTSYGVAVQGPGAWDYDYLFQNGATLDEGTNNTVRLTGAGLSLPTAVTNAIAISGANTYGVKITESQTGGFYYETNQLVNEGQWVHGVKVELTRAANQQIAGTGTWFGGQFVLNAGSSGYTTPTHGMYAVHGVLKGSDGGTTSDFNAGRFETQSGGKSGALLYVLTNSGTTVGTEIYIASHANVTEAININAQSSSTVTKGIRFMTGSGSAITTPISIESSSTYGIDLGSATIATADIRLSTDITISSGSGSPDGSITAPQGSLYIDTAGAADAQLWINESGGTGWCKVDTTT